MGRKVIVMLEVADDVSGDELHEAICRAAYEGKSLGMGRSIDEPYAILDVQIVGYIEDTVAEEDATEEQRAAVEGAVLRSHGRKDN